MEDISIDRIKSVYQENINSHTQQTDKCTLCIVVRGNIDCIPTY